MFVQLGIFLIAFLVVNHLQAATVNTSNEIDLYQSAYYDFKTGSTLKGEVEDSSRFPITRIGFRGLPCECQTLSCGCCAGINITQIKFQREACTNFSYDPYEFSIMMDVSMDGKEIYSNGISAKNPPPLCMPFPYLPAIEFCVRFYNIFTPGNNLHACMDFETRAIKTPVLVLHFDCVRMGQNGVVWVKPEDNGGLSKPAITSEIEIYDEVNFEAQDSSLLGNSSTTTLSPEDEDKIGQLKL